MSSNFEDTVCIDSYTHLERAIGKNANCKWAGKGWPLYRADEPLEVTVKRVMPNADWVIYYAFEVMLKNLNIRNQPKQKRSYKVAAYIGDIHRVIGQQVNYINRSNWDVLLMLYTKLNKWVNPKKRGPDSVNPDYYRKNVKIPIFHMAPSINPEIFKPTDEPKNVDVAFLGAVGYPWYPLRFEIWKHLPRIAENENWKVIIRQSPPGRSLERKISSLRGRHFVGSKYADILAHSKIFIFGTSIFKYPLLKFPEGMASRTCVMSDTPLTAKELHLVPNWNFVEIAGKNWEKKLRYYLRHQDEREEIAQRGYDTFLKYHTTDIRAKQIIDFLWKHMK